MVIESYGTTSLVQVGSTYSLYPVSGSSGPQIRFSGAAVTLGQFSGWVPIGAEQTAGGYQVAWKVTGADQYTVWNLDSSGNYLSNAIDIVSGSNSALQTLETTFQQDLNGDGNTGTSAPPPSGSVIEAYGSTRLMQIGNTYSLYPISGSSGPQIRFSGAAVTSGQFTGWAPIGAEQTASGYQVAWKVTGADQYTVWNLDSSGNYLSNAVDIVSASNSALQALETSLHQDLNGDGTTGVPAPSATVIEAYGSTKLMQIGNTYSLYPVSGSSGPQIRYSGAAVTSGQFGSLTPIGAEQTAGGYQVAWKITGADQYTVWNLDSSGNYLSAALSAVSASNSALQTLETTFRQDLNGDGNTGATTVIEAYGSTRLMQTGNTYSLYPVSGSSGPQIRYSGAAVTSGQFGSLTPIGAEQTAGGYQVAWKVTGADQYTVWNLDSSGNYLSAALSAVSGSNSALQTLETTFQQDLNGDGNTGAPSVTVIESYGSTRLMQIGNTYSLYPISGSSGPQIRFSGAAVTSGQFTGWAPIGAEQTASGYQVAWKVTGADQYTVWNLDSSGNYLSNAVDIVSASNSALQTLETNLHQDLNGDGTTGVVSRFDITVNYTGNSAYQSYFTAAAQRWQQIITADLPNVNSGTYGLIDDLLITANVSAIDGVGGILGQAGPDLFRSGTLLPYHGVMTFDSADLANMASNGTLSYVILHEMGHILGIGTLWSSLGLKSGFQYTGANALAAYRQLSGNPSATYVPLETGGGSGTAGAHWSEAIFGNELMTGYIAGVPDPISSMTIGALKDLGYTVNTAAADAYTMPGHLTSTPGDGSSGSGAGQLAGDGNLGTLAFETDTTLDLLNDEVGNGHSGVVNLALFTDYIASTFVTQPGEGTGTIATPQTSGQEYLTRPAA